MAPAPALEAPSIWVLLSSADSIPSPLSSSPGQGGGEWGGGNGLHFVVEYFSIPGSDPNPAYTFQTIPP